MQMPVPIILKKPLLLFALIIIIFSNGCGSGEEPIEQVKPKVITPAVKGSTTPQSQIDPNRTPRPSPKPRPTPSLTPTPSPTPIPTPTPVPTPMPEFTPAATAKPSPTPTPFVPPRDWIQYTNEAWKYTMYLPSGWTAAEFGGTDRMEMASFDKDARINVTATFSTKPVDEWTDGEIYRLSLRLWNFRMISRERVSHGKLTGWKVTYTANPNRNVPYQYIDLFVSEGEVSFHVSAYAMGNFLVYIPALDLAVQSFRMASSLTATPVPWWYIPTPTPMPTPTPTQVPATPTAVSKATPGR